MKVQRRRALLVFLASCLRTLTGPNKWGPDWEESGCVSYSGGSVCTIELSQFSPVTRLKLDRYG